MAFGLKLQHQFSLHSLACWLNLQTTELPAPTIEGANSLK